MRRIKSVEECPHCAAQITVFATAGAGKLPTGRLLAGAGGFVATDGDRAECGQCHVAFEVYVAEQQAFIIPLDEAPVRMPKTFERCGGDACEQRDDCLRFCCAPRLGKLKWFRPPIGVGCLSFEAFDAGEGEEASA